MNVRIDMAKDRMRIIKEDLEMVEVQARKLMQERAELILKLVATRETILANKEQDE